MLREPALQSSPLQLHACGLVAPASRTQRGPPQHADVARTTVAQSAPPQQRTPARRPAPRPASRRANAPAEGKGGRAVAAREPRHRSEHRDRGKEPRRHMPRKGGGGARGRGRSSPASRPARHMHAPPCEPSSWRVRARFGEGRLNERTSPGLPTTLVWTVGSEGWGLCSAACSGHRRSAPRARGAGAHSARPR